MAKAIRYSFASIALTLIPWTMGRICLIRVPAGLLMAGLVVLSGGCVARSQTVELIQRGYRLFNGTIPNDPGSHRMIIQSVSSKSPWHSQSLFSARSTGSLQELHCALGGGAALAGRV
jgi:hypothetical protein